MYRAVAGCCVFWPAFGCCAHLKAGRNLFFCRFSTFFVNFKAFLGFDQLSGARSSWKLVEIHNSWLCPTGIVNGCDLWYKIGSVSLVLGHGADPVCVVVEAVDRQDLRYPTFVGLSRENPVLDYLSALHYDNWLYINLKYENTCASLDRVLTQNVLL